MRQTNETIGQRAGWTSTTPTLFAWFGVGDIDGDGYPDRLSSMTTLTPGRIIPGECYGNANEKLVSYLAGAELTVKNQDGIIHPFGYGPVQSGAHIHCTGPPRSL